MAKKHYLLFVVLLHFVLSLTILKAEDNTTLLLVYCFVF